MPSTTKSLFTYGTLQVDEIWRRVAGKSCDTLAGTAHNFAIRQIHNAEYPGIYAALDETVSGVVYLNVDQTTLARLDSFEGRQYVRRPIEVECEDEVVRTCDAYLVAEDCLHQLSDAAWRLETFVQGGALDRFWRRYTGFEALEQ